MWQSATSAGKSIACGKKAREKNQRVCEVLKRAGKDRFQNFRHCDKNYYYFVTLLFHQIFRVRVIHMKRLSLVLLTGVLDYLLLG